MLYLWINRPNWSYSLLESAMMSITSKIMRNARNGDLIAILASKMRPRRLAPSPSPDHSGHSARRINALLQAMPSANRYLEIGLEEGYTFENVSAPIRWGVDPRPRFDLSHLPAGAHVAVSTSDEFFESLTAEDSFDVIFLDGLHTFRQTYRDLVNACQVCPQGVILIDDVVPADEISAMPDQEKSLRERSRRGLEGSPFLWHGDIFRVVLCVRQHHPELSFCTLVGAGNPQTLVWHSKSDATVTSVSEFALRELDACSYDEIFRNGIPETFNPREETQGIAEWAAARH